jgi:hypothetical protein
MLFPVLLGIGGSQGLLSVAAIAQITTIAQFQPPPMSSPGNREAGGQRDDTCTDTTDTNGLLAIVPSSNIGLTTQPSPDLFAYVPPNNAQSAEIRVFKEATNEEVFVSEISLPKNLAGSEYQNQSSIVQIPLSATTLTLEPDENYLWALFIVCNPDNRAEDIVVDVAVRRAGNLYLNTLPEDLKSRLATVESASNADKLETFGTAGIWYDLLAAVNRLATTDPALHDSIWTTLLAEQGMEKIVDTPVYTTTFLQTSP